MITWNLLIVGASEGLGDKVAAALGLEVAVGLKLKEGVDDG